MGLIKYYKDNRDFIRYKQERTLRYNHIKEMIEYFEENIFEQEKKRLINEENMLPEEAKEEARKKAWIEFVPVELNDLAKVTKSEENDFEDAKGNGERNRVLEEYKQRLQKSLLPQFKRVAKIRDLSNAKCINFASVSIAQLVDWVLTFLDACSDADEFKKDDLLQGNFNIDLEGARSAATAVVKKGPKTEVSDKAEELTKEIIKRMDANLAKQTLNRKTNFPQQGREKTGISKKEIKDGVMNIFGDLAAVDYPAWHATAMMIKEKYRKELKQAEDDSKIVRKHADYVMAFYTKEVFLNKVAAFFMKWFMQLGISLLKKSVKIAFPLDLTLASAGLTLVFMGPPMADTIREEISAGIDVALFESQAAGEEIKINLPAELFKDAYQNTIERYDIGKKLEGYSNLYYSFTEEIEGEKLPFIVKHEIDAPGAWTGICNFGKRLWDKGLMNLYSILPESKRKFLAPGKIVTGLDEIEHTLASYKQKLTEYEGIEAVYGYIDDIKKLAKSRNHVICGKKQGAYAGQTPQLENEAAKNYRQKRIKNLVEKKEVPLPILNRIYDLDEILQDNEKKGWDQFRFRAYFNPEVKRIIKKYNSDDYKLDDISFKGYSYFYYGGGRYNFYAKVFEGDDLAEAKKIRRSDGTMKRLLSVYAVKKLKKTFPALISKTRSMVLDKHVFLDERRKTIYNDSGTGIIRHGEANEFFTPIEGLHRYKVIFKTLDQIAKKKGIKEQEMNRGRLLAGENLLDCSWYSLEEIKKATDYDGVVDDFPLADRITKEFVILHQDTTGQRVWNEETLKNIKFPEYEPNWDTLYGSAEEEQPGGRNKFEFKPGVGTSFNYKGAAGTKLASSPEGKIEINGAVIGNEAGEYEPVKGNNESIIDFISRSIADGKLRYKQDIDVDGKTLRVKYIYDLDGGWINSKHSPLPKHMKSPYLVIQYKYISEDNDIEEQINWDRITIKQFKNGDYGIEIPDKGGSLPGSRSNSNHKISSEEIGLADVKVEDAKSPGVGKIKAAGTFLKAQKISSTKIEDKRAIWKLNKGETLSDIAKLFYNDISRWRDLEKKDGSNYTKEEAREIPADTKIYIPCK